MIQKHIFFDNMIFIAILGTFQTLAVGTKKSYFLFCLLRLYYLLKYIRTAGSWNNSVLASRWFLTFDWVSISSIYLLGPWLLLNSCPCSVQSFCIYFSSSWVLKLTVWIPHVIWSAWIPHVIWPAWITNFIWSDWISPVIWPAWISHVIWSAWIHVIWSAWLCNVIWPAWIPHVIWSAWIPPLKWPAWVPMLYDLLGSRLLYNLRKREREKERETKNGEREKEKE